MSEGADSKIMNKFILAIGRRVNRLLYPFGYKMTTVGYLNARDLVRLAGGRGEKLTAYKEREYAELDPRCKGRGVCGYSHLAPQVYVVCKIPVASLLA